MKGYVTGLGSVEWKRTHDVAGETAVVVTTLLKNGATCLGKTIMDELGLGYLYIYIVYLFTVLRFIIILFLSPSKIDFC